MSTTKVKIPDGKGGWLEVEGEAHPGAKADAEKQASAIGQAFIEEAGKLTEQLMKYGQVYARDQNLEKEHVAFAAALYCINLRETYPDGPEAFDQLAASAATYYDENAPKVPETQG